MSVIYLVRMTLFAIIFATSATHARPVLVVANGDLIELRNDGVRVRTLGNLNDLLERQNNIEKAGRFSVIETAFDYRTLNLFSIVRNRTMGGVIVYNLKGVRKATFHPSISRVFVFSHSQAPAVLVATQRFVTGDEFEQNAFDSLRFFRADDSGHVSPLSDWATPDRLFTPLRNCFFPQNQALSQVNVSPLELFGLERAQATNTSIGLASRFLTRLGCWNEDQYLYMATDVLHRGAPLLVKYDRMRESFTVSAMKSDPATSSCFAGGKDGRYSFCLSRDNNAQLFVEVNAFGAITESKLFPLDGKDFEKFTPYVIGSNTLGSEWAITLGHPRGLGEGVTKATFVLTIDDSPRIERRFESETHLRGFFELP